MASTPDYHAIIIGSGIVGLATAVGLLERGITNIRVYEKATALDPIGAAIGLFPNGIRALEAISPIVAQKVLGSCIDSHRHVVRDLEDQVLRDTIVDTGRVTPRYLVWYLLQKYLYEAFPESKLSLGHVFQSFDVDDGLVTVRIKDRSEQAVESAATCRVLIGADGIKSSVRMHLFGEKELTYHRKLMFRAVLDMKDIDDGICPPAGTSLAYQGGEEGKLFAFRETATGIMTFTSMAVFEEPELLANPEEKKNRLKSMFANYPSVVHHVLEKVPSSAIYENAVLDMDVLDEWSKGPVILVGDAAHAMTPGLGQGANQGLEDACELSYSLSKVLLAEGEDSKISAVLDEFWMRRIERVKEVHSASRGRSAQVNQSSNKNAVDVARSTGPAGNDLMTRLYAWTPSVSFETP